MRIGCPTAHCTEGCNRLRQAVQVLAAQVTEGRRVAVRCDWTYDMAERMTRPGRRLLLVGWDELATRTFASALEGADAEFECVADRSGARRLLGAGHFDAVLVWCRPAQAVAAELLEDAAALSPESPLIAVAYAHDIELATGLVQAGASDFLSVPFTSHEAVLLLERALLASRHAGRVPPAPQPASKSAQAPSDSPAMLDALATADRAARSSTTILIRGESGVGKEVLARRIHENSARANGPFVKVHCAALPEQILESELFGYEKGAFTGAASRKPGRFELARGGTIFLDEIGDISRNVQLKLLRVVQDREYERLGGTEVLHADVRILTATHRNLERMVKTGEFREDLYYRLNVLRITVPPLRSRLAQIELLARTFCTKFAQAGDKRMTLEAGAIEALQRAPWPGNVRQLQNVIERLVVLAESDRIEARDVDRELGRDLGANQEESSEVSALELAAAVRKAERRALARALERSGGNRAQAARILGVSRRTLFYKLREHALE